MAKTPATAQTESEAPASAENTTQSSKVTFPDGRIVEFKGKRKLLKESFLHEGHPHIRLDFANGETRTIRLHENLLTRFAMHGAEQKFGDAIAGLENIEDAVMAVDELAHRLNAGDPEAWAARKASDSMAGTSVLARALVEHTGKPIEKIKEFLLAKNHQEKLALRNSPKLKPIIERLEAGKKKAAPSVDADAVLAELG